MAELLSTPRTEIALRAAGPEDAAALRALRLEALTKHPTSFAADVERTANEADEQWAARLADYAAQRSGLISVACAGEALVGMAGLGRGHWPKTSHAGTIWGVYVQDAWRGAHVAEALLDHCAAWARAQGLTILRLGVVANNTPAIRCYARCGYQVYGLESRVIYWQGVYYDELLMAKSL